MRSRKPYGTLYTIVAISVSLALPLQLAGAAFGLVAHRRCAAYLAPNLPCAKQSESAYQAIEDD